MESTATRMTPIITPPTRRVGSIGVLRAQCRAGKVVEN
jgi:hypothetical protein